MPAEALRDMWATLKAAEPWIARVKHRRNNGDRDCVRANVTPALDGGRLTGCMSVRTTAGADGLAHSEVRCVRTRDETAAGKRHTILLRGALRASGLAAVWQRRWAGCCNRAWEHGC